MVCHSLLRQWKNQTNGEASAFLSVLSVRKGDSGSYKCTAGTSQAQNTIIVHVLNGTSHSRFFKRRPSSGILWYSTSRLKTSFFFLIPFHRKASGSRPTWELSKCVVGLSSELPAHGAPHSSSPTIDSPHLNLFSLPICMRRMREGPFLGPTFSPLLGMTWMWSDSPFSCQLLTETSIRLLHVRTRCIWRDVFGSPARQVPYRTVKYSSSTRLEHVNSVTFSGRITGRWIFPPWRPPPEPSVSCRPSGPWPFSTVFIPVLSRPLALLPRVKI
jgi:hypothetical protein